MMKNRLMIIAIAVAAGLVLACVMAYVQKSLPAPSQEPSDELIAVTEDAFGGPYTLTDQNGKTVTEKDFAKKYKIIYFGFTYCPAICPTELSKITTAVKSLGEKAPVVQPMFITVDPERDTPDKMKTYVELFHPSLVGLSGTPEQIKSVLKEYKIYAAKRQEPGMTEYTMDHSTFIYFIAPDDRLLHIFKMEDTAEKMTDIMTRWLTKDLQ